MTAKSSESASKIAALGRANKTEAVQIRFDPKRRFVLEMVSRRFSRPLSSLLEEVTNEWLARTQPGVLKDAESAWSPFESERFVMQAALFHDVLTDRELVLLGFIKSDDRFWRNNQKRPRPKPTEANFDFDLLRDEWDSLCQRAIDWQDRSIVNGHATR